MGEVLERLVRRMERHLRRSGLLRTLEDEDEADGEGDPEGNPAIYLIWKPREMGPAAAAGRVQAV